MFHILVQMDPTGTLLDPDVIAVDVAIEPSNGTLIIAADGQAVSGSWPCRAKWGGAETFEEFLCAHAPSWIAGKLLGDAAVTLDRERTKQILIDVCGDENIADVYAFLENVDEHGEILPSGAELEARLSGILMEPVDGFIFVKPTEFTTFLINDVLPKLLKKIQPPETVTNQTNLKLC